MNNFKGGKKKNDLSQQTREARETRVFEKHVFRS
jgi:hypothetical protein